MYLFQQTGPGNFDWHKLSINNSKHKEVFFEGRAEGLLRAVFLFYPKIHWSAYLRSAKVTPRKMKRLPIPRGIQLYHQGQIEMNLNSKLLSLVVSNISIETFNYSKLTAES